MPSRLITPLRTRPEAGLFFECGILKDSSFPSRPEEIKPAHQRAEYIRFLHSGSRKMSVMAVTSNRSRMKIPIILLTATTALLCSL
jgi:hypothetical protein